MLNLGELATAVQEGVPVITCVFNDRYGILRFLQDMMFEGRRTCTRRTSRCWRSRWRCRRGRRRPQKEFEKAFTAAVETAGPSLIDVDITGFEPMRIVPQSPSARDDECAESGVSDPEGTRSGRE